MKISARYEVLGLLGQGGMGVVYHVRDTTRGRENALKTLAPGRSDDIVERFLTEAQVMFRLEHDNIVRVYDFGKDGETYFLTMELIRGKNLRQLLNARQNKGFALADVIRMGIETADALNYAHSQKPDAVVHRDIKPVNIMIEEATGRVVVTDFGIAKLMADTGGDNQAASDLSRTVFAGTVPYSAPEQFQPAGTRRLDARVDIYALGIVLFEIYTGRHFFAGLSADEVELHHRSIESGVCPVKSPHACDHKVVLADTPDTFVRVLERAIARDRNERYRTAGELLADLRACATAETVAACEAAHVAAESAGALEASPTDFRRGSELEEQAKAAQAQGDSTQALALFRDAMQAFNTAASQAGERRAQLAVQQAKAAMQVVAREATDRDTTVLAPDAMREAAQLVASADASESQGQYEQAATLYRQAEEAFRAALASARQASARREIEGEMPALRAAREQAEEVDAETLAADAFAEAVRQQLQLEEALAAGELTRVRELLPTVREGFASAEEEAKRRLRKNVDDARAAVRAVAAEATASGAPANAKAAFIEAETLAGAADKLVERGQLELGIAQLQRAADAYRVAITAAARAAERTVLEKELPAIREARAEAERAEAPTLAPDAFNAAATEQAELERALAAGELTRVRELVPQVTAHYANAKAAAVGAQASRAAVAARTDMAARRDAARTAGAEQHAPDALAKAGAREREAAAAEQRQDWTRAEQLYRQAAKAYDDVREAALRRAKEQALANDVAAARNAAEAARARAKEAGAAEHAASQWGEGVALVKKAAGAANDADGMAAAAANYARARETFEAATVEADRIARHRELQGTFAAAEEERKRAVEAGAEPIAEFTAGADKLAEAERAFVAGEFTLAESSAKAARDQLADARKAAERQRAETAADATLSEVAARAAEAGEAGAETLAPARWSRAVERQKQALARRHDGELDAVIPLAAEALQSFADALDETTAAAAQTAAAARAAAELAGPDDKQTSTADKHFATAEQRRGEGQLVAAAVAFRKATTAYEAATKARTDAAHKAEADAKTARREADGVEAATHAADDHRRGVAHLDTATKALSGGRFREAETAFEEAARAFRGAAQTAARERKRTASLAARDAAEAAKKAALGADAEELAAAELKRANDAFTGGARALETENFAGSEADFTKAKELFERARDAAVAAALEREVATTRSRVESLRESRAAAASGFFAGRKLKKADAVVARATAAAASGDFATAKAAYAEAATLFEAMPAAATPPPPPPPPAAKRTPAQEPAPRKGKKGGAPSPPAELGDVATVIGTDFADVTEVGEARSGRDATVATGRASKATSVGRAVPIPAPAPARGVPTTYIIAAVAILLLLAGAYMAMNLGKPQPPKVEPTGTPKTIATAVPPIATAVPPVATKVPTAVPSALPPPTIERVSPTDTKVEPSGDTQDFGITLADPKGATYAWSVDGKPLANATTANATVDVIAKSQRVAVVARTASGEVRHEWELAALKPPASPVPPVPPTTAPEVTIVDPTSKTVSVVPGKSRRFTIRAKTDAGTLRYAWTVDGKPAGTNSPSFDLAADAEDEGATRRVRVEVTAGGPTTTEEWTVTIPIGPITIRPAPATPTISNEVGDTTQLFVEARAGSAGTKGLTYAWTVNDRPVDADGARYTYRAEREGTAEVEVRVTAPERQAAIQRWTIRTRSVVPTATPPPPAPRATSTPVQPQNARGEIERWTDAYRTAYEQKNVDRLVALGVVKAENSGRLGDALKDLADLKVAITSLSIEVQGPDTAVVSFTRQDTFMAGGRPQTQSIPIKKSLRKVGGAWVAQ